MVYSFYFFKISFANLVKLLFQDELQHTDAVNAKLFSKAKKLCRSVVSASKYQPLNSSLFDVVSSIHEDRTILNRMDVRDIFISYYVEFWHLLHAN